MYSTVHGTQSDRPVCRYTKTKKGQTVRKQSTLHLCVWLKPWFHPKGDVAIKHRGSKAECPLSIVEILYVCSSYREWLGHLGQVGPVLRVTIIIGAARRLRWCRTLAKVPHFWPLTNVVWDDPAAAATRGGPTPRRPSPKAAAQASNEYKSTKAPQAHSIHRPILCCPMVLISYFVISKSTDPYSGMISLGCGENTDDNLVLGD